MKMREAYEKHLRPDHDRWRTVETYRGVINAWEKLTGDPPVDQISNATLAEFRQAAADAGRGSNTVRHYLRHVRAILRRLLPADGGNPGGVGILTAAPWCKMPRQTRKPVTVCDHAEVRALYSAASGATWPRKPVQPADWWRAFLVTAWNTGLRVGDLLSLRWNSVDLDRGLIDFGAEKTGKSNVVPLHPLAVDRLSAIVLPVRVLVFPVAADQSAPYPFRRFKASFYRTWHRLRARGDVVRTITPHDFRRTVGSDLFATSPGAAAELLQHSNIETTRQSYAQISGHTARLMLDRPQPFSDLVSEPPDDPAPHILKFPGRSA